MIRTQVTHEILGRMAVSSILAILGTFAITAVCVPKTALLWWLLYTVACGIVLNTKKGEPHGTLLVASVPPAVIPATIVLFLWLVAGTITCFTVLTNSPRFPLLIGVATLASLVAIYLFSYSRNLVLAAVEWLTKKPATSKLKNIESAIRAIAAILIAIAFLSQTLSTPLNGD